MKKRIGNSSIKISMKAAAAIMSCALVFGGCTPSGNLASKEKEQAAAALTETPAPTNTPTPEPTATITPTPTPALLPSVTPAPATPIPALSPTPIPAEQNIYYTTNALNVRAGASADSDLLGQLDEGTKITVLEVVDNWARFEYEGQSAYVSMSYLVRQDQYDPSEHSDDYNYDNYDRDDDYNADYHDQESGNGNADGGESGTSDGGSDGGTDDGGTDDGGADDGGEDDGGMDDGGADDGGADDGGSADDDGTIYDEIG